MLFMDVLNTYFTPYVSKEYCTYFYILSVIFGALFGVFLISGILLILLNFRKAKFIGNPLFYNYLLFLGNSFLAYFVNRLLYSMCVNSLN